MTSFGPSDIKSTAFSYPGIFASRFNPVEAQKVWSECLKKEKEGRHVHSYLDSHGKLGLDAKWAKDVSRTSGLMPDYESLSEVYQRLGWKILPNGRVIQPDLDELARLERKSGERKAALHRPRKPDSTPHGLSHCVSEPASAATVSTTYCTCVPVDQTRAQQAPTQRAIELIKGKHKITMRHAVADLAKAKHKARTRQVAASLAKHDVSSAGHVLRAKPLRPGNSEPPTKAVRGAHHLVRPGTALVHMALRKSSSLPGSASAKRAAQRESSRPMGCTEKVQEINSNLPRQ